MSSRVVSAKEYSENQILMSHTLTDSAKASAELATQLAACGQQLFSFPGVHGSAINLVNDARNALVTMHLKLPEEFSGVENGYKGFQYHFDQPDINVQVFKSGKTEIVTASNLDQYPEITRIRFERWKMQSLLVFPLTLEHDDGSKQVIGTATAFSQDHFLDESLARQLEKIANRYTAKILELWKQHQSIERKKIEVAMTDNMQQFFACVTEMNSLTTVGGVYALIAKELLKRFHFDAVSILMADNGELSIVETAFSEPYQHLAPRHAEFAKSVRYSFNVSDGQSGFVYTHNQHFHVEDVAKIVHLPMSAKDRIFVNVLETIRTLLIVPIRHKDAVIGTMTLSTLGETLHLSETDLKLIELLASFSSTAICNAKAHELVEQKNREIELLNQDLQIQMVLLDHVARKDRLTGLNNFGNFEEELKRRTSEYARTGDGNSLSAILFDVDHFKLFNDSYGHLAGNQILQEVANRIMKYAREMDFVARYGGEEFAMLLPQCDLESASMIADRIRCKISDEDFVVEGMAHNITISGGCAQFLMTENPHGFIYRVDAALYSAKRNGRNRIEKAPDGAEPAGILIGLPSNRLKP